MQRITVRSGIAVLALLALGACDMTRNPTAPEPAATPHFNTNPAPSPTVTNSGGYPLISWSALTGATSYSVVLREKRTEFVGTIGQTQNFDYPLGSTTGTSFHDTSNPYTGKSSCTTYGTYKTVFRMYSYMVTATFPDGTTTGTVAAPVSPC